MLGSHCVQMADETNLTILPAAARRRFPRGARLGFIFGLGVVAVSLLAAVFLPKGAALAALGDTLQVGLIAATAVLAFRNFMGTHSRLRAFWFLIFAGSLLWTASSLIWSFYEVWFARPVPDVPVVDILLFVKLVPLTAAVALAPEQSQDSRFRGFGILDVLILMLYSLYLFAFSVFAYRLLPGAADIYNFNFNLADAIGNQIFMIVSGVAVLRSQGHWRNFYRLYFFAAACYALASDVSNVAIDMGNFYTGSLYDMPLIAFSLALPRLCNPGGPDLKPEKPRYVVTRFSNTCARRHSVCFFAYRYARRFFHSGNRNLAAVEQLASSSTAALPYRNYLAHHVPPDPAPVDETRSPDQWPVFSDRCRVFPKLTPALNVTKPTSRKARNWLRSANWSHRRLIRSKDAWL